LTPLTSAVEQPSDVFLSKDPEFNEEAPEIGVSATSVNMNLHTIGAQDITSNMDITQPHMEAQPVQQWKVRYMLPNSQEPTVSHTTDSKTPETKHAKAEGAELAMCESEMDLLMGGFMTDEPAPSVRIKQKKGKPEVAVAHSEGIDSTSVSAMLLDLIENMNDSTSSIAHMPYVRGKLRVRATQRKRADGAIAQLSTQARKILDGIQHRDKMPTLIAPAQPRLRKTKPKTTRAKFEDSLRNSASTNIQPLGSPVTTEQAWSLAEAADLQHDTPETKWFRSYDGNSVTSKETTESAACKEQEEIFAAQLMKLEVGSDESVEASYDAPPVEQPVAPKEESDIPPVSKLEAEAMPSTNIVQAPVERLPLLGEEIPVPATWKRTSSTQDQKSEKLPNTTFSPEPSRSPMDEVSVQATPESTPSTLQEESETPLSSKVEPDVAHVSAQVNDDNTITTSEPQLPSMSPSKEAQDAAIHPATSFPHLEPEPVGPLFVGPYLSRMAQDLKER
jgi:hypothetical protein